MIECLQWFPGFLGQLKRCDYMKRIAIHIICHEIILRTEDYAGVKYCLLHGKINSSRICVFVIECCFSCRYSSTIPVKNILGLQVKRHLKQQNTLSMKKNSEYIALIHGKPVLQTDEPTSATPPNNIFQLCVTTLTHDTSRKLANRK